MPEHEKDDCNFSYDKKGFLEGLITGMGYVHYRGKNSTHVRMREKDEQFVNEISKLAKEIDINSRYGKPDHYYYIDIKIDDSIKLINPTRK